MHRFYISPENWNPDALTLSGSEAHHCRDVLRMTRGDKAVIFNGRGREITAEIVDLHAGQVRFRKLHESSTPLLRCHITLGQAIPKGKNMELIVQKAVETLLVLAAGSVAAQNTPVPPPARDPKACSDEQRLQAPNGAARQPSDPSNQTLSDKLERSEGVVCPPAGVDPEIAMPPPGGGLSFNSPRSVARRLDSSFTIAVNSS